MFPLECALNILLVAQAVLAACAAACLLWFGLLFPGDTLLHLLLPAACFAVALLSSIAFLTSHWRYGAMRRMAARNAALQIEADTDPLTGLGNRRAFTAAMQAAIARAVRERQGISLIVIDIDHFKLFNDSYGHVEGDRALLAVADAIQEVLEPGTRAYRIGGEEMAVVLPGLPIVEAARHAHLIQAAVEGLRRPNLRGVGGILTVSIGVAEGYPAEAPLPPDMLREAADRALYEAKDAGRACIRLAAIAARAPRASDAADDSVEGLDILLPNGSRLAINSRLRLATVSSILSMVSAAPRSQGSALDPPRDSRPLEP